LAAGSGGSGYSPDTVKVITAIMVALLRETLSRDLFELAMGAAEHEAVAAGVPEKEFKRVSDTVTKFWTYRKSTNPLASLF
jgi:hypothetical protein